MNLFYKPSQQIQVHEDQCTSSPHLRTETDPVSETLRFLVSRIPDDGQGPKIQ
jgi:hypothetical protein